MSPVAVEDLVDVPVISKKGTEHTNGAVQKPQLARRDANDPATTTDLLVEIIERDGGVIVENIISQELAGRIKSELKPFFDTDKKDASGFFPHTTQRATGLLARSDGCVELAMNPTFINVANKMISSTYTYWSGDKQETVTAKPIISSTVGFRVNPGGKQQGLHRDDRWAKRIPVKIG
jgi:ectoine hydroxylase-related dioxygenase (phytanoyl-CoA dioxygenase family)